MMGKFLKDNFLRDFEKRSSTRKIRILDQGSKISIFLYYFRNSIQAPNSQALENGCYNSCYRGFNAQKHR